MRESSLTRSGSQKPTSTNMRHGMECEENVHIRSGRTSSESNQNVLPNAAIRTGAVADQMLFEKTVTGWYDDRVGFGTVKYRCAKRAKYCGCATVSISNADTIM